MADLETAPRTSEVVIISPDLRIPASEIHFRFSRSSGPGGQHVNRSETRVELLFDIAGSPSLTEPARERLLGRLAGRIDGEGTLHIISAATRSQAANRNDAVERFRALLLSALRPRRHRVPTHPGTAARERRLVEKRERSALKQARGKISDYREE